MRAIQRAAYSALLKLQEAHRAALQNGDGWGLSTREMADFLVRELALDKDVLTLLDLTDAILSAEERLGVEPLYACVFGDGSGHVMAPMHDYSNGGERTDETGDEVVFEFERPADLMTWLREGKLPEQRDATPNAMTCEDDYEGTLA